MKNLTDLLDRYLDQTYDPVDGYTPGSVNDLADNLNEILGGLDHKTKIEALQAIITHIDNMPWVVRIVPGLGTLRNGYKKIRTDLLHESVKNGKATPATGKKKKKGKGGNPNPKPNETTEELRAEGKKNTPTKKAVIEKAKEIYEKATEPGLQARVYFQTPSGHASKKLYAHRDLLSEFPEVNERTIRDWVEKAWDNSEI